MRYTATYGLLSGLVVCAILIAGFTFAEHLNFAHQLWFGYLVMLVVLTFIFVGVKRYRDVERGGVIKFLPALGLGLAIAAAAGVAYALLWEVYLAATHYRFMDQYIAGIASHARAAGLSGEKLASKMAELETMRAQYANPLFRIPMTFLEIFPVGFIVALVSAILLRFPKFLPARR
ncbi:MAG: DUF4199 domain-containing protein [Sphingomonas bacterium]